MRRPAKTTTLKTDEAPEGTTVEQAGPPLRPFTVLTADVKERVERLTLGKMTAVVGEEASYKSSIGIAARLALTGQYDPIGKLPSDLIKLAADPLVGVHTTLSGPDGTAEWKLVVDPETGKPKRPSSPHFEGRLGALTDDQRYCIIPTDSIRDLLKNAKGERKHREALIRRFGGAWTDVPEPFALGLEEKAVWTEAVTTCKRKLAADASGDEILSALTEHFRLASGQLRREMTTLEQRVRQRRDEVSQRATSTELLPELEKQLAACRAYKTNAADHALRARVEETLSEIENDITTKVEAFEHRKKAANKEIRAAQARFEHADTDSEHVMIALKDAYLLLGSAEANAKLFAKNAASGILRCPYCPYEHESVEVVAQVAHEFEQRITTREKSLLQAEAAQVVSKTKLAEAQRELDDARHVLVTIQATHDEGVRFLREKHEEAAKQLEAVDTRLSRAPKKYTGPAEEELQTRIDALRLGAQAKLDVEKEGLRLRSMEKEHAALKTLEKEAIEMQKRVMHAVATTASEAVSLGMLDGRQALLDPETCEWAVVGQDGHEHVWGAMCGTEKTSLLLGLAAAWTRGAPFRFPIFDDEDMVGLSDKGIRDFYARCETLVGRGDFTQVMIISNRPELVPGFDARTQDNIGNWTVVFRERRGG